jgi:hypothetical protein
VCICLSHLLQVRPATCPNSVSQRISPTACDICLQRRSVSHFERFAAANRYLLQTNNHITSVYDPTKRNFRGDRTRHNEIAWSQKVNTMSVLLLLCFVVIVSVSVSVCCSLSIMLRCRHGQILSSAGVVQPPRCTCVRLHPFAYVFYYCRLFVVLVARCLPIIPRVFIIFDQLHRSYLLIQSFCLCTYVALLFKKRPGSRPRESVLRIRIQGSGIMGGYKKKRVLDAFWTRFVTLP